MEFSAQLEKILSGNSYGTEDTEKCYDWLTEAYHAFGDDLTKLRKELKEAGHTAPFFVIDFTDGKVIFRRNSFKYTDGETGNLVYSRMSQYKLRVTFDYITSRNINDYDLPLRIYKKDSHLIVQKYHTADTNQEASLLTWIESGQECECGNHFISQYEGDVRYDVCYSCQQLNVVHEYGARAEDILGFEETEDRLFGVELEYEGVNGLNVNKHLKDHAIAKRDGSIKNGVEVVTKPACITTHKKALLPFFESVKTQAASNTGMHVHVSRKGIGELQLGFMLFFMNRKENLDFICKIAGRDIVSNNYCKPLDEPSITYNIYSTDRFMQINRDKTPRYSPINTTKSKTYEFRIFSSPESHLEMAAKLDFVKAIVDFSSPYAVTCAKTLKEKADVPVFLDFIKRNKKDYPDFVTYFKEEVV